MSFSACPTVGTCVMAAFDAVYKAAENYPKDALYVSNTTFKVMNVAGPLTVAGLNLGSQILGWKWTQQAYNRSVMNEEKSAAHKYVPFMIASGSISLIQTMTGALASPSINPAYKIELNTAVASIMNNQSCSVQCAAKAGQSILSCTMNYFAEAFQSSEYFNVATWIQSDAASQLFQLGGVNLISSALLVGFAYFQMKTEMKVTGVINPLSILMMYSAAMMFVYGLVQGINGAILPYESDLTLKWKNCEVIS